MTVPSILKGTYISAAFEDPDQPGQFITACGLTTRTFTEQVNTRDRFTRDCGDPEDIPSRKIIVESEQWDLNGSGLFNRATYEKTRQVKGVSTTWRFFIGEPTDDEVYGGYHEGPAVLIKITLTGADSDDVTADVDVASDGDWAFVES